jgi:hypothetical protein
VARIRNAVEIFNTNDLKYGGSGAFQNQQIEMKHNNGRDMVFKVAIPPLATIVVEEHLVQ